MVIVNSNRKKKGSHRNRRKHSSANDAHLTKHAVASKTDEEATGPAWQLVTAIHQGDTPRVQELLYGQREAEDMKGEVPQREHGPGVGLNLQALATLCGMTLMHLAAESGNVEILDMLAEQGLNPDVRHETGLTPLELAVRRNNVKAVEWFLDRYGEDQAQTHVCQDGRRLLNIAVDCGHAKSTKVLLARGACPDHQPPPPQEGGRSSWQTPLVSAAGQGFTKVVKALLGAGAQVDLECSAGLTPLTAACVAGVLPVVELLLAAGADPGCTCVYRTHEDEDNSGMLLVRDDGEALDCGVGQIMSPLLVAAGQGHDDIVALLLAQPGINTNVETEIKRTPLHHATEDGYVGIMRQLISKDASVNHADCFGKTPLHIACSKGPVSSVKVLLEAGADPNAIDIEGRTPGDAKAFEFDSKSKRKEIRHFLSVYRKKAGVLEKASVEPGSEGKLSKGQRRNRSRSSTESQGIKTPDDASQDTRSPGQSNIGDFSDGADSLMAALALIEQEEDQKASNRQKKRKNQREKRRKHEKKVPPEPVLLKTDLSQNLSCSPVVSQECSSKSSSDEESQDANLYFQKQMSLLNYFAPGGLGRTSNNPTNVEGCSQVGSPVQDPAEIHLPLKPAAAEGPPPGFEDKEIGSSNANSKNIEYSFMSKVDFSCILCKSHLRDIVLFPCKHLCICKACSGTSDENPGNEIKVCPVCQESVISSLHVVNVW